jgi:hypothetical protein
MSTSLFGYLILAAITVVGIRLLSYGHSFVFHWRRYRQRHEVTTAELKQLDVPYLRLHITTLGAHGSTEVILRNVRNVAQLAEEDPEFYGEKLTVEICTESPEQEAVFVREFRDLAVQIRTLVLPLPGDYQTPHGTQKKARSLHYMVERRREGWGKRPGRTFVVHYDEESVIEPGELRKLMSCLATTDKKVLEGPIYYPLEYTSTSLLCRAMEASRPIGCFECRSVMERGVPLHLHGSNLVVEEEFENEVGWDMGCLDGQPFIAEDFVFGTLAFLKAGPEAFGWHGVVMLEQPPFSYRSAFKQRARWITGVFQGLQMLRRMDEFWQVRPGLRFRLQWGTRFRILTFALGAPIGLVTLLYLPFMLATAVPGAVSGQPFHTLPLPWLAWLSLVGLLWLGSTFIGAWCNTAHTPLSPLERWTEIAKTMSIVPIAGMAESAAGLWATARWLTGRRQVSWQPTPKPKQADQQMMKDRSRP